MLQWNLSLENFIKDSVCKTIQKKKIKSTIYTLYQHRPYNKIAIQSQVFEERNRLLEGFLVKLHVTTERKENIVRSVHTH